MNILIDIGHPAHVHIFKHIAREMIGKGHQVLFTCRDKEFEISLLEDLGFAYKSFGQKYNSIIGKTWGMIEFDIKEFVVGLKFKPDFLLSHGSIYASHVAFLLRKPHITFEDTFNFEQIRLYKAFTDTIFTSDYNHPLKSPKVIRYAGYNELAYLHKKRFTPDKSVLSELGVTENEKYVIFRLVSWNATHDIGHSGLSSPNIAATIQEFSKYAKVFISSESKLPVEFLPYKIKIKPGRIHDAIAFSTLVFGESSTMSEEAAMLGVPSIYLYNSSTIYTQHLENDFGLILNFSESDIDQRKAIEKGVELLKMPDLLANWKLKTEKLLANKIDVSSFLVWFIENFPESKQIMKDNPNYQYTFT
jgi:uncharacterized protein